MELSARGVRCTALVHSHNRSIYTQDCTVSLGGRDIRVVRTGTWAKLVFAPLSPAFPRQLRRLVGTFKPDILHLHMPNPSVFWALLLPSARRIPWVVHWHADIVTANQSWLMQLAYALYRPFEQAVLKRTRVIIATSPPYHETSAPLRPWLAKCRVVPLGLDTGRLPQETPIERERAEQPTDQDMHGLRILAVGRLTYYKGFQYLIEALTSLATLRLELVGEGDEAGELKRLVKSLSLEDRVRFHGAVDDMELARQMAHCDCLCLPSIERTEAFGLVLLEAMSFGKATVVSDVEGSGMGWVVEHGVTGLKVPPADVDALAAAFRQLDGDRESLRAMGLHGREKFERSFDITWSAKGVVETYRDVLHPAPEAAGP